MLQKLLHPLGRKPHTFLDSYSLFYPRQSEKITPLQIFRPNGSPFTWATPKNTLQIA